jgi:uncharacterized coiled-coil DUF342 family protein
MKYIQNTHVAPITVNGRDDKGKVLFTKRFMPEKAEKWTGQVVSTGYTELTDEEFKILEKTSRTFNVYTGKTGKAELLVVCDELPPEAKTPHEALVDARKEARKSAEKIAELDGEIVKLKTSLFDAETKYKQLQSASGAEEALKPLQDANAALKAGLEDARKTNEKLWRERDAAVADVEKLKAELEKAAKKGGKEKDCE